MPDTLADMAGTLGSDAVVPVSPDMMDAASQAAEVSHAATLSKTAAHRGITGFFCVGASGVERTVCHGMTKLLRVST